MKHEFPSAKATEMLDTLFQRMQDCGCHSIPVMSDGRLAGLMTMDNLRELLLIDETLQRRSAVSVFTTQTASRILSARELLGGNRKG